MPRRTTELLHEALEEAALVGAKEIKEFLGTYRGKDPERLRRVQIAISRSPVKQIARLTKR